MVEALPAFVLLGLCTMQFWPVSAPAPQKLKLRDLTELDLQLIPKVGPSLARQMTQQGADPLSQIKGIGPAKESLILPYLDTSP